MAIDPENPLHGLSPDDMQRAAMDLPDDVLRNVAVERGSQFVGSVVTQLTGIELELRALTPEDQVLKDHVGNFLDPDFALSAEEQLGIMDVFYGQLDKTPPQLSEPQLDTLRQTLEANPGKRVVPTPLLDLEGRLGITEAGRELPCQQFNPNDSALWVPEESAFYGKFLRDPQRAVVKNNDPSSTYALRYKTIDGRLTDRSAYIDSLVETGQAVIAEDGTVWTYPLTDVRIYNKRTEDTAAHLHDALDPLASPELLIVTHLLHQISGTVNHDWWLDVANEAIYLLDENGQEKSLYRVANVHFDTHNHQLRLGGLDNDARTGRFGIRETKSGLLLAAQQ